MAGIPNSKLLSYEEWLRMPVVSDGIEEVVNGEIRRTPPNKWDHAEIVENVRDALIPQLDRRKFRVVTRVPDLAVFDLGTIIVGMAIFIPHPHFSWESYLRRTGARSATRNSPITRVWESRNSGSSGRRGAP